MSELCCPHCGEMLRGKAALDAFARLWLGRPVRSVGEDWKREPGAPPSPPDSTGSKAAARCRLAGRRRAGLMRLDRPSAPRRLRGR